MTDGHGTLTAVALALALGVTYFEAPQRAGAGEVETCRTTAERVAKAIGRSVGNETISNIGTTYNLIGSTDGGDISVDCGPSGRSVRVQWTRGPYLPPTALAVAAVAGAAIAGAQKSDVLAALNACIASARQPDSYGGGDAKLAKADINCNVHNRGAQLSVFASH